MFKKMADSQTSNIRFPDERDSFGKGFRSNALITFFSFMLG
jgi:hypothetical protein